MTGIFSGCTVFVCTRHKGACTGGVYLWLSGAWVIRAGKISYTACMVTRAVSVVVESATSRDTVSQVIDLPHFRTGDQSRNRCPLFLKMLNPGYSHRRHPCFVDGSNNDIAASSRTCQFQPMTGNAKRGNKDRRGRTWSARDA